MNNFLNYIDTGYKNICDNVFIFDAINDNNDQYKIINLYYKAINLKKNNNYIESKNMFLICIDYINDYQHNKELFNNILYECYINLALLNTILDIECKEILKKYYNLASCIFPERSEPFFYYGIYCNKVGEYNDAYESLISSKNKIFENIKNIHPTSQYTSYGKYVNQELINSCLKLRKYDEAMEYIIEIINDNDFRNIQQELLNIINIINTEKMKELEIMTI